MLRCDGGRSLSTFRALRRVPCVDGLIRRRRQRPQQFDQMGAALDPAQEIVDRAPPAGPDLQPFQLGEGWRDRRAGRIGSGFRGRLRLDHRKLVIKRQPKPHVMKRFARLDLAPELVGKGIGLDVGQMAFDVPETVFHDDSLGNRSGDDG